MLWARRRRREGGRSAANIPRALLTGRAQRHDSMCSAFSLARSLSYLLIFNGSRRHRKLSWQPQSPLSRSYSQ